MMAYLAVLLIFFLQNIKIYAFINKKAPASWGPPTGALSLDPTGGLPSLRPPGPPPFAHSKYCHCKLENLCGTALTVGHNAPRSQHPNKNVFSSRLNGW